MKHNIKREKRIRRHTKIRTKVAGTSTMPRLAVFRSNKFMYAQLIDDENSKTLAFATSHVAKKAKVAKKPASTRADASSTRGGGVKKVDGAFSVGKAIAEKALALKIKSVVFDRGGFGYKGRVKALAEGAREGGLTF